ncbi:MAG: hypothetical protein EOM80_12355 [Erysipelotrichia bacterium]|nr:hypothetical protein [Erysipelotrichia bacterium]
MKPAVSTATKTDSLFSSLSDLPFLFVGSGFARRYLGLPDWAGLLKIFAEQAKPGSSLVYDSYVQKVKALNKGSFCLPAVASAVEADFNERWFAADEFKQQREKFADSVHRGISPFKLCVADYVTNRTIETSNHMLLDELACFSRLAKRSLAGVITTNYDTLIEKHLEEFKVFIGQDELVFSAIQGVAEIYKIHGSCTKPDSLVINQEDYEDFDRRNAYLAAKLLTIFVEHPIIFIGYSITDSNIRSILTAIIDCLPSSKLELLKDRMIFVEWNGGDSTQNDINTHSIDFGNGKTLTMTRVFIDRFMPIFSGLLKIKARYNLSWMRRLKNDIYELVKNNQPIDRVGLLNFEGSGENEPQFVVGVGTSRGVEYKMPDASDVYRDIVMNDAGFDVARLLEDALPKLFKMHSGSLPFYKYLAAYGKQPPDFLRRELAESLDHFRSDTIRNEKRKSTITWLDFETLCQDNNFSKALDCFPLLDDSSIQISKLESILKQLFSENKEILESSKTDKTLKTKLRRVIKMFDWLKFGRKEKAA